MSISHTTAMPGSPNRGRLREFDLDQVLDRAVRVFSERGYGVLEVGIFR
jgi:TetR/AcrR family transcriptional regulator, transcriptional repressor for nem operon